MINYSGIGRYISEVIPLLVEDNKFSIFTLGNKRDLLQYRWFVNVTHVEFNAPIFSIKEQVLFKKTIPLDTNIFWSPNFNVPLFLPRSVELICTIHDALPYLIARENFDLIKLIYIRIVSIRIKRRCKIVFTVSNFSKSEIVKYFKLNGEKIVVTHLGFKTFPTNTSFNFNPAKVILTVGNIKPHKNIVFLIDCFNKINRNHSSLKLVIVGEKDKFLFSGKAINISKKITNSNILFTGKVSDEDLARWYNKASLFVFPSKYEGFGLPLIEAMSLGLPIVASDIQVFKEIGNSKISYFNVENKEMLISKIEEVLEKPFHRIDYTDDLEKYSWIKTTNHIKMAFYELLDSH